MKESIIKSLIGTILFGSIVFTIFGCGGKNDVTTVDVDIDGNSEISVDTETPVVEGDSEKKTGVVEVYSDDSYNEEIGVKMRLNKLTTTGTTIEFVDTDDSKNQELFFGEEYYIEKKTENGWEPAKDVDLVFIDIAYVVPAGEPATIDINWADTYGELESGDYRISKGVSGKTLSAYFTVN